MNPLIASVFYKAGLIENWGRGTINIINYCADYGIPEPKFKFDMSVFGVILNNVTDKNRFNEILQSIKSNNKITSNQLAKKFGVSKRTVLRDIEKLKKLNLIDRVGNEKTGYWEIINNI